MITRAAVTPLGGKIFALVAHGLSVQAIANQLDMNEQEIEEEVSQVLRSLDLRSRVELLLFAYSKNTEKKPAAA